MLTCRISYPSLQLSRHPIVLWLSNYGVILSARWL